ncbi:hypothetical protein GJ496_001174 [Pomphorhynchus laevis]|nr:hypothetical protein GJ496_001174 [Pomphorhynchus laevis]
MSYHSVLAVELTQFQYPCILRIPADRSRGNLFDEQTEMFIQRLLVTRKRLMRHDVFRPVAVALHNKSILRFKLSTIDDIKSSCNVKLQKKVVLASIRLGSEGSYVLEDDTGIVNSDLKSARFHDGYICENSMVLAEGYFDNLVFVVSAIGMPPIEPANASRSQYSNLNLFVRDESCHWSNERLRDIEYHSENNIIVILTDVYLNSHTSLKALRALFTGYSTRDPPPTAFIFCGNFLSTIAPVKEEDLKQGFLNISKIILQFETLCNECWFIFVMGPEDYGLDVAFPRPQIKHYEECFGNRLKYLSVCSNPVWLTYCTQTFVIFREDLLQKLLKNCINKRMSPEKNISQHMIRTILSQAHLCPLPLSYQPIYWRYDHALRLDVLPDLLIIADSSCPVFSEKQNDCLIVNPNSFSSGQFYFTTYQPYSRTCKNCKIDT